MFRRRCSTGKVKYFNEAWAQAAADARSEASGRVIRPYHCPGCRWWHLKDRTKERRKKGATATRERRERNEQLAAERVAKERLKRGRQRRRQRRRRGEPLCGWENEGGALGPAWD